MAAYALIHFDVEARFSLGASSAAAAKADAAVLSTAVGVGSPAGGGSLAGDRDPGDGGEGATAVIECRRLRQAVTAHSTSDMIATRAENGMTTSSQR